MTVAAFAFTPDPEYVDRAIDAELRGDQQAADKKIRAMLAALDDSLAGISEASEELHTLHAAGVDSDAAALPAGEVYDRDIAVHLEGARRSVRAALAILRAHAMPAPRT